MLNLDPMSLLVAFQLSKACTRSKLGCVVATEAPATLIARSVSSVFRKETR